MDLKALFKDFNASKFVFFGCLLPLSLLLSLKLNGNINWSIYIIFIPVWVLNILVVTGAIVGSFIWCQHPEYRRDREPYADYKAMLITVGIHLLLIMFEILMCINIQSDFKYMWTLVFTPLFFAFPIAIAACVWGIRNDRSPELELILSANVLLFIFIALRLDGILNWSWSVVFIPLWIVMSLPIIFVMYYFIWTLIFFRTNFPESDRQTHLYMAIIWLFIVVPLLSFEIVLVKKLDGLSMDSWLAVFIPLHITLLSLILSAFGGRNGNKWWFGIRTDFCQFLLEQCPCLRLYANISFNFPADEERPQQAPGGAVQTDSHIDGATKKSFHVNIINSIKYDSVRIESIETPD